MILVFRLRSAALGSRGEDPARFRFASDRTVEYKSPVMWETFKEFLLFLRQEKKWWLMPIILVLLALGAFLLLSSASPLAPFLYPLF